MTDDQGIVSDELLDKQADYIYDRIHSKIFREEWRELYKTLMKNEPRDILKFFADLNTPQGIPYSTGGETAPEVYPNPDRREDDGIGLLGGAPRW